MTDIPEDPKRIRARIRRYERKLEEERREFGCYHDGAGKRYFIGPLYLLMGDLARAVRSFQWFDQVAKEHAKAANAAKRQAHKERKETARSVRRVAVDEKLKSKVRFAREPE
jgi:hypothetical protein